MARVGVMGATDTLVLSFYAFWLTTRCRSLLGRK